MAAGACARGDAHNGSLDKRHRWRRRRKQQAGIENWRENVDNGGYRKAININERKSGNGAARSAGES